MKAETKANLKKILPPPVILPLLFSYLVEHVAISIYWIFFGIDLFENLTSSYFEIALIFAIPAVVSTIGTAFLSNYSDKTGNRKRLLFLSRIALLSQYILLIFFRGKVWSVLLILVSFGLMTQIYYPTHSALITIICPPDRKGEVSSYQVLFASAGWMIGSSVSSIIYNSFSINGCMIFSAVFALASGSIALISTSKSWASRTEGKQEELEDKLSDHENVKLDNEVHMSEEIVPDVKSFPARLYTLEASERPKKSYLEIIKQRKVIVLIVVLIVIDFGIGPYNVISNLYLEKAGLSHESISLSNTIATAFGMIILLIVGRLLDISGRRLVFLLSIAFYPLIYSLMFFLSNFPVAIFAVYLFPLYALKNPTSNAIMADITHEDERSRGMSLISIEQILAGNTGAIIGCLVADNFPTDVFPYFISDGIFVSALFPTIFGFIALIMAIFLIKETNPKTIERRLNAQAVKSE